MKIIAGIVGGFIMAIICALLVNTFVVATPNLFFAVPITFFVFWVIGIVISVLAESPSRAWRVLLITSAIFCFLLPLSVLLFTRTMLGTIDPSAGGNFDATTAGIAMGGFPVAGVLGFIGFFLGVGFLIVGLFVGRQKHPTYFQ